MPHKQLIVLGSGGHAKVVLEILKAMATTGAPRDTYDIRGFTSDSTDTRTSLMGCPRLGDDGVLEKYRREGVRYVAIGVGGYRDNALREMVYRRAESMGFEIVGLVHPTAILSPSVRLGAGSVVFPGALLHTEVTVGVNCIIATRASVDHESTIGDHVLISAGVTVGANVSIGDRSLLAIGSTVISGRKIGRGCLVAAGAVVVQDAAENSRLFGVPARDRSAPPR